MTPEEQLFNELKRLTDNSDEEIRGFIEALKAKVIAGFGIDGAIDKKLKGMKAGGNNKKKCKYPEYTEDYYPHYRLEKDVRKYVLRISLRLITPTIWRKIEVPSNISLRHLSEALIDIMGWLGGHLNQFRIGNYKYYEPFYQRSADFEEIDTAPIIHTNQEDVSLSEVLNEKGKHIIWEYDFGDSWEHEVRLSSIKEYAEGEERLIKFIGGERACPPEDCGSYPGYDELCSIAEKKKAGKRLTKDEKEFWEWSGHFNPEVFDVAEVEECIAFLNEEDEC